MLYRARIFGLMILIAGSGLSAASAAETPSAETPAATSPADRAQAEERHAKGLTLVDEARTLESERERAATDEDVKKLETRIAKAYKKAIGQFRTATTKDPQFRQAFVDLGDACRNAGQHDEAVKAYDRALVLEAGDVPVIEHRAASYLALNRLDDARSSYEQLLEQDPERAAALLDAMKLWVIDRRSHPGELSPQAVRDFQRWIKQLDAAGVDMLDDGDPGKTSGS